MSGSLWSELVPAAILLKTAQRWCRALDHPADDCLYLALAEMCSAVLLTQDQRLLKKLQTLPDVKGERFLLGLRQLQLSNQSV